MDENQQGKQQAPQNDVPEADIPKAVSRERVKKILLAAGCIILFLYTVFSYRNPGFLLLGAAACAAIVYYTWTDLRKMDRKTVEYTGICVDTGNDSIGSVLLKAVRSKRTYVFQGAGKTLVLYTPAPVRFRRKRLYKLYLYDMEEQDDVLVAYGLQGYQKIGLGKPSDG